MAPEGKPKAKPKHKPKIKDKAQSERFIEASQERGVHDTSKFPTVIDTILKNGPKS